LILSLVPATCLAFCYDAFHRLWLSVKARLEDRL